MGVNALPTQAQRQNQKSGVALEKIQSEQSIGSYHLVDSYDQAIKLTGRIINHWLAETDLGETKRPIRSADGKHKLVQINTDAPVTEGEHTYHFEDHGLDEQQERTRFRPYMVRFGVTTEAAPRPRGGMPAARLPTGDEQTLQS